MSSRRLTTQKPKSTHSRGFPVASSLGRTRVRDQRSRVQGGRRSSHLPPPHGNAHPPPPICGDRVGASLRPWSRISVSLDNDRPEIGSYSHGRKRSPPTLPEFLFLLLFPSARPSTQEIGTYLQLRKPERKWKLRDVILLAIKHFL